MKYVFLIVMCCFLLTLYPPIDILSQNDSISYKDSTIISKHDTVQSKKLLLFFKYKTQILKKQNDLKALELESKTKTLDSIKNILKTKN